MYQPYIEGDETALNSYFAMAVIADTMQLLGKYTPVSSRPLRSITLPHTAYRDNMIIAKTTHLGIYPHNILLTRRDITHPDTTADTLTLSIRGLCVQRGHAGTQTFVSITTDSHETDLYAGIATLTHELTHGFGAMGHCTIKSCIMQPLLSKEEMGAIVLSSEPFCNAHANFLQSRG